jgi:hypothetical protein
VNDLAVFLTLGQRMLANFDGQNFIFICKAVVDKNLLNFGRRSAF